MSARQGDPHFRRAAICGVGLLGGSLGLALRERALADHVVGVGRNAERLAAAQKQGATDSYSLDLGASCADADLIVLCGPVSVILDQLPQVIAAAPSGALITDVGSTKASIVRCAGEQAREDVDFVGSHPMAGSERSGAQYATADCYEGATVLLTPDDATSAEAVERAAGLWEALGSRTVTLGPDEHDRLLASLSHLPHLAAAALAAHADMGTGGDRSLLKRVAGPGFETTTRLALGSVPMWLDIFLDNRDAMVRCVDDLIGILEDVKVAIGDDHPERVREFLENAAAIRREV